MRILAGLAHLWLMLAPLPHGIALNFDTQECAGYWGGDEYMNNELPEGWVAYYPGAYDIVETDIGSCTYQPAGGYGAAERCCRELGYSYAGDSIGIARPTILMGYGLGVYVCRGCLVCLGIGLVVALLLGAVLVLLRRRGRRQ